MEIDSNLLQSKPASSATINVKEGAAAAPESLKPPNPKRLILLLLNALLLLSSGSSIPLLLRVYFIHGGRRLWFASFLQTTAFPILLPPLLLAFLSRRRRRRSLTSPQPLFLLTPRLLLSSVVVGVITGLDNFLYAYGLSYLPASTSALLLSTQLGCTAVFAFFLVKQRLAYSSINAVVLLTFGAVVLGVHANGDRPAGESKGKYLLGFVMALGAAAVYGLVLPLVELMYIKSKQAISYALVMEMQFVITASATAFCAVGMLVNNDFQAISREASLFNIGETKYYVVVVFIAILCEFFFLGLVGTINYSSALLSGIMVSMSIPISEVLAVIFFHEKFDGDKGIALALSVWGTASYFYGEYTSYRKSKAVAQGRLSISESVSENVIELS